MIPADSSIAYVNHEHILTAEQLIEGMLLPSGNDAAYVLATVAGERIAEDPQLTTDEAIAVFVEEMNREAARFYFSLF